MMHPDEFRALVEKMRAAQRRFFRDRDNLQTCKGLEAMVDEAIARMNEPPGLFDRPATPTPEEPDPS